MREYSIPHLRQAGRISIPEDSFDRIREARDLHKEGLGTETVRRQLRQGSAPDSGELDRRLDTLHRSVEDLHEDVSFSPTQRTILARQSLLMSAVFNLTEMIEELLLASRKPRKRAFQDFEPGETLPESHARARLEIQGEVASDPEVVLTTDGHDVGTTLAVRPTDFGALRRRRRRRHRQAGRPRNSHPERRTRRSRNNLGLLHSDRDSQPRRQLKLNLPPTGPGPTS